MLAGPQTIVRSLNKHQRCNAVAPEVVTPTKLVTLASEQECIDRLAEWDEWDAMTPRPQLGFFGSE